MTWELETLLTWTEKDKEWHLVQRRGEGGRHKVEARGWSVQLFLTQTIPQISVPRQYMNR